MVAIDNAVRLATFTKRSETAKQEGERAAVGAQRLQSREI